jgi:DNA-binding transcriptional LysR family regulator
MTTTLQVTLKQLETLCWVSKLGSFQAAALRLNTSQSAISKRVAELESIYGKPLFDRSRRTARLTQDGLRLVERAEELLALGKNLFVDAEDAPDYDQVFRLGASDLIGMTWLARFVRGVVAQYPRLHVEIEIDHGGRLLEKLNQEQFDLALMPGPMLGNLYEALALKPLERQWLASPSLGIPNRVLTVEDLSGYPIVMPHPDSILARFEGEWLRRNGFVAQRQLRANSFLVQGAMVLAGLGVAQLPVQFYAGALKAGQMVKVRTRPALPNVRYFAVYRRNPAHALAAPLAKLARKHCDFSARAIEFKALSPAPADPSAQSKP